MNLVQWEPFKEMEHLLRRYAGVGGRLLHNGNDEWTPTADISETEKEYLIKAELPEVKKEDVKITLQDGVITLSGERKQEKEEKGENRLRVESFYGSFSRSFSLPDNVDAENVRAESKDGVLRIHIPKTAVTKAKQITIEAK